MSEKDPWKKMQTNVKKIDWMGWALALNHLRNSSFCPIFTEPIMMARPGKVMMAPAARAHFQWPVLKRDFFVVVRWGEMFSYSANRIRTTKSKTQSWITKKMSRIANVIFIVLQMYNHDCHILLIASRGALRYVQRHLSWTLITCVNMVRFKKS